MSVAYVVMYVCAMCMCLQVISRLVYADSCETGTFVQCAHL